MKARRSIRFWLLALIVTAILPVTLFAGVVAERLAEAERLALIEQLRQRTEMLAHAVERQLDTSFTALSALAESAELQRDDFAGLHALARRLLSRQAIGTTIGLVGRDGRFILNTHFPYGESLPPVSGDDISRQVFATSRPQASDLFLGTVTLDLLVTLDVPVFRDGQVIYDLRIGIRPDTLASVLAEQALPHAWAAVIVDRKGRFIARSHAPDRVGEQASAQLRERMAVADSGIFDGFTITGMPVKASFQKMRSSGWTVVIGVPQAVLAAPTQRSLALVGAGGFGLLLVGGTSVFLLARRLSLQIAQATAAAVALGEGAAPAIAGTDIRELSELRSALGQAHHLLSQREERLALALDAAQAAPWEYDAEADRLVWSAESARLYGFDPANPPLTLAAWLDIVVDEDRPALEAEIRRMRSANPDMIRTEFRVRHPDAGTRCLLGLARAVYHVDGALLRVVGLNLDITERKAAEEALRESRERLVFVLDAANAGWWDWDLRSGTAEWSDQLRRLLGYDGKSVVPSLEAWAERVHPEDRATAMDAVMSSLSGRQASYRSEYRVIRPGDGFCWVLAIGRTSRGPDGQPLRMVGLSLDITELKKAEHAMLEAKREAEEANLAKSMFLASASHDLRQPVQSLMLFTSLLSQQLEGREAAKAVGYIEKAALALKTLLDGILDISRLDAGVVLPEPIDIAAGPLLDQLADEYRLLADQKQLELRMVHTSLWLRTDRVLLERILRNLIENAIKYTPAGRILIGCRRRGGTVRIEVWDTGLGIAGDEMQAIFLEFHQLNNPERDRAKGLGLGLAIVERLARLLEHPVLVRSTPGRGSCFSIAVPVGAPKPPIATPPPATHSGLAVVVDDEEEIRDGLQMLLNAWGYEVVAGADHREVLPSLAGRRPDLVLTDYRLRGGLTGIEMLRAIAQAVGAPGRGVVLTGDTAAENIIEARAGGYEVLLKPVSAAALQSFLAGL